MRFVEDCQNKKELFKYLKLSKELSLFFDYFIENCNQYGQILIDLSEQSADCKNYINILSEYKYKFKTKHIDGYGKESTLFIKNCRILIEWGHTEISCVEDGTSKKYTFYGIDNSIYAKIKKLKQED